MEKLSPNENIKYSEILALDKKILSFNVNDAPTDQVGSGKLTAEDSVLRLLRQGCDDVLKGNSKHINVWHIFVDILTLLTVALALLHRYFFARAYLESGPDPTAHKLGPSFLAAYRAAVATLRGGRESTYEFQHIIIRVWPVWSNMLSNAVILGTVATCGLNFKLAAEAFGEFSKALDWFSQPCMPPLVKSCLVRFSEPSTRIMLLTCLVHI